MVLVPFGLHCLHQRIATEDLSMLKSKWIGIETRKEIKSDLSLPGLFKVG